MSETTVYCSADSGPNDCNWEGTEDEVIPISEDEMYRICELGDDIMDYAGKCPLCGSPVFFGPSAR